ncbi:MAG: hypothetical protein IJ379_03260 [Lachnospiraceae bacterium]|nr:hypothetical protein [Lachnospiraceae bacterium]
MGNEQMMEKLRKELLLTRIFSIISSVLMVCLLVGGFLLYNKAQEFGKQVEAYAVEVESYAAEITPVVEQLAALDVAAFNDSLTKMNAVVDEVDWQMLSDSIASVDWEKVSKQLEALDVEAINKAIEGLDTKELTNALENMNNAVDKLRSISEAFSNFAAKLGFGSN